MVLTDVRRALLAAAAQARGDDRRFGERWPLRIDPIARTVNVRGRPVCLARLEFDLLAFLARHPRQVFTRTQLVRQVWGYDLGTRTVDTHIRRLRAKLGDQARRIVTVRGVGYRLDADPGEQLLVD